MLNQLFQQFIYLLAKAVSSLGRLVTLCIAITFKLVGVFLLKASEFLEKFAIR